MRKILPFLLIVCVLLLSACGQEPQRQSLTIYAPIEKEPVSLDPQIASSASEKLISGNCFEGLVRVNESGVIDFGTAVSYTISPDGLVYTFNINPQAKYHLTTAHEKVLGADCAQTFDASVTAEDFEFAVKRALLPDTDSSQAYRLYAIKNAAAVHSGDADVSDLGVSCPDSHTLVITLEHTDDKLLYTLASPVAAPCSEEFFTATSGKYGIGEENLLCNGALYLSSWSDGVSLTAKANPEYCGKADVNATAVNFSVNSDRASYLPSVVAGNYSCAFVDSDDVALLSDTSALDLNPYENSVWCLYANCALKTTGNENIRKALFYSFKSDCLTEPKNCSGKTKTIVPECCISGEKSYGELSDVSFSGTFSEKTASELWKKGIKELDVSVLTVNIACSAEFRGGVEKLVQNWQKVLGVSLAVHITTLDESELYSPSVLAEYNIAIIPVKTVTMFADEFLEEFCANYVKWDDNKLSELIHDASSQTVSQQRVKFLGKVEKHLYDACIVYPLYSEVEYFAVNKGTTGLFYFGDESGISFAGGARYGE